MVKFVLAFLLVLLVSYILFSVGNGSFSPKDWDNDARGGFVYCSLMFGCIAGFIGANSD